MTSSQETLVTHGAARGEPVLALSGAAVEYRRSGQRVRALDGVDLTVARGEIVAGSPFYTRMNGSGAPWA